MRTKIAGVPIARAKLPAWIDDDDRLWCDHCVGHATREGVRVTEATDETHDAFVARCTECRKRFP